MSLQIDDPPAHLLVILETHPTPYATNISLPTLLSTLLLLINAHLSLSHQNTASFIASTPHIAKFLYPASPADSVEQAPDANESSKSMYRPFNLVKSSVTRNLQHLLANQPSQSVATGTQLAGAMSLGLTYINRLQIDSPLTPPSARILIVSTSGDSRGQYIPIMNAIFAAQKAKIPIDVVRIADDLKTSQGSTFLQQASFTTNGVYTPLPSSAVAGLPQYLLQLYAADQATRGHLVFPKRYGYS